MAKQIPEITIIPTPTAGQESIIETVVARHDTYTTSRMTLAQIFTLGSISGAIKSALDALSALIATNTSDISNKLNKSGELRTGLTANRAIITDASGVETYLTGTAAQVIGFDGAGKPIPVTPSMDIQGLTTKNTPITADLIPIYDSESGLPNKNFSPNSINLGQYGNGSDGNITVSGTVTMTSDKQYKDVTLSDGCILKTNGFKLYISGTLTRSGTGTGYIDTSGTNGGNGQDGINSSVGGAAGGVAGTIPYTTGTLPIPVVPGVGGNNTSSGAGGAGTAQTKCLVKQNGASGGASGTSFVNAYIYGSASAGSGGSFTATDNPLITLFDLNLLLSLSPPSGIVWSTIGASAGAGASTTTSNTASGGGGGAGANGGVLWVAVRNILSVGASAIFRSIGGNGGNGGNGYTENYQQFGGGGGGGGGGNGGVIIVIYSTSNVTVSSICDVTGGTGGTGGTKAPGSPYNANGSNGGNGSDGLLVTYTI